ncbi:MAG: hypothetical protein IPI61_00630 [Syntrophaceae bacterium]|nr:hypothetical protein [Syntrophaceae bacterium]
MARPSGTPGKKKVAFPLLSRIESLPVLLAILCFGILAGAGPELRSSRYVFEPPWLLLVLNTVFITGLGVLITALCFRSFLRRVFKCAAPGLRRACVRPDLPDLWVDDPPSPRAGRSGNGS